MPRYRDDYDDRPSRRRPRDDYDQRDDYADDPAGNARRRPGKGVNIPGVIGMILGIVGLIVSLFPCIGWMIGGPLALGGLILGVIGLCTSRQTTGRGFPIAATIISVIALLVGGGWFLVARQLAKESQARAAQFQADVEKRTKEAAEQARADQERALAADRELREGKATPVTAAKLYQAYRTNAVDADRQYGRKLLEVSGPIHRVEKDRFGRLAVELDAGGDGLIRCDFPRGAEGQLKGSRSTRR